MRVALGPAEGGVQSPRRYGWKQGERSDGGPVAGGDGEGAGRPGRTERMNLRIEGWNSYVTYQVEQTPLLRRELVGYLYLYYYIGRRFLFSTNDMYIYSNRRNPRCKGLVGVKPVGSIVW